MGTASPMTTTTRTADPSASQRLRPMRFDGERRFVLALEMGADEKEDAFVAAAEASVARAMKEEAALAYGFVDARRADAVFDRLGWTSLGPVPLLVRPLRLSAAAELLELPSVARPLLPEMALVLPFGRRRRSGFREIATQDPRVTRLWDRFSIDIGVAVERSAKWIGARVFDRPDAGYRVFIFEDGDRYVIRALCIFRTRQDRGRVVGHVEELLHDRSVAGMRAASHLLGLAVREMSDAGAESAVACSLVHSGSFPILVRHGFLPASRRADFKLGVRAFDPALADVVTQRHQWYLSGLDFDGV